MSIHRDEIAAGHYDYLLVADDWWDIRGTAQHEHVMRIQLVEARIAEFRALGVEPPRPTLEQYQEVNAIKRAMSIRNGSAWGER